MNASDRERFWAKVEQTQGCWLWRSSLNNKGYGQFHLGAGSHHELAHRVASSYKLCDLHHEYGE
jgi:hypothetical protein